ncbi:MAG: HAMP domain-containing histidine kinase [Deltaproteobacteria bacterium]|nr:HAMP domain-containing histidine kinase [Deltaproteobacteria bacterium]
MLNDPMKEVFERVRSKKESYQRYNFERLKEEAFATFFDLAQEIIGVEILYQIIVAVPKEFFDYESRLYVIDFKTSRLTKVCGTEQGLIPPAQRIPQDFPISDTPYELNESILFPIRGNEALTKSVPFLLQLPVLGFLEIYPRQKVDERDRFFMEKYANRIGYNLHQKMLIQQNIDHIRFTNQLVADIEHNVISPNLYYKLFLIRLKRLLSEYRQAQERLRDAIVSIQGSTGPLYSELCQIHQLVFQGNESLEEEWKALSKHFEHTSLFLETLLRRDHFEKGTYVLRKQTCNFRTEIIQPLLERYQRLFDKRGIVVDNRIENVPDEQVTLFVDKGLISQVFDNFFSNAVKYTQEVEDQLGNRIKLVSYNRQILRDFFGEGIHGVRFNFFTTGKPLSQEDAKRLFEEGFRASLSAGQKGSGHGLHFVRNVVEIHGGKVGCEPQPYGNLVYFTLPMKEQDTAYKMG